MKYRWAKSQVDIFVAKMISRGERKVSDRKQGNVRIITLTSVRIICKPNGWVELQPIG